MVRSAGSSREFGMEEDRYSSVRWARTRGKLEASLKNFDRAKAELDAAPNVARIWKYGPRGRPTSVPTREEVRQRIRVLEDMRAGRFRGGEGSGGEEEEFGGTSGRSPRTRSAGTVGNTRFPGQVRVESSRGELARNPSAVTGGRAHESPQGGGMAQAGVGTAQSAERDEGLLEVPPLESWVSSASVPKVSYLHLRGRSELPHVRTSGKTQALLDARIARARQWNDMNTRGWDATDEEIAEFVRMESGAEHEKHVHDDSREPSPWSPRPGSRGLGASTRPSTGMSRASTVVSSGYGNQGTPRPPKSNPDKERKERTNEELSLLTEHASASLEELVEIARKEKSRRKWTYRDKYGREQTLFTKHALDPWELRDPDVRYAKETPEEHVQIAVDRLLELQKRRAERQQRIMQMKLSAKEALGYVDGDSEVEDLLRAERELIRSFDAALECTASLCQYAQNVDEDFRQRLFMLNADASLAKFCDKWNLRPDPSLKQNRAEGMLEQFFFALETFLAKIFEILGTGKGFSVLKREGLCTEMGRYLAHVDDTIFDSYIDVMIALDKRTDILCDIRAVAKIPKPYTGQDADMFTEARLAADKAAEVAERRAAALQAKLDEERREQLMREKKEEQDRMQAEIMERGHALKEKLRSKISEAGWMDSRAKSNYLKLLRKSRQQASVAPSMRDWPSISVYEWLNGHGFDGDAALRRGIDGRVLGNMRESELRALLNIPGLTARFLKSKIMEACDLSRPANNLQNEWMKLDVEGVPESERFSSWSIADATEHAVRRSSKLWIKDWEALAEEFGSRYDGRHEPSVQEMLTVFTRVLDARSETERTPQEAVRIGRQVLLLINSGKISGVDAKQEMQDLAKVLSNLTASEGRLFWMPDEASPRVRRERLNKRPPTPPPEEPEKLLPPHWEAMMLRIVVECCAPEEHDIQIKLLRKQLFRFWDELHELFDMYKIKETFWPQSEETTGFFEPHSVDVMSMEQWWLFAKDADLPGGPITLAYINRFCTPEYESMSKRERLIETLNSQKGVSARQERMNCLLGHQIGPHGSQRGVLDDAQFGENIIRACHLRSLSGKGRKAGHKNATGNDAKMSVQFSRRMEEELLQTVQHANLPDAPKPLYREPEVQRYIQDNSHMLWLMYRQFAKYKLTLDPDGRADWKERDMSKRDPDVMNFNDWYEITMMVTDMYVGKDLARMAEAVTSMEKIVPQVHPNNNAVELTFDEFCQLTTAVSLGVALKDKKLARLKRTEAGVEGLKIVGHIYRKDLIERMMPFKA